MECIAFLALAADVLTLLARRLDKQRFDRRNLIPPQKAEDWNCRENILKTIHSLEKREEGLYKEIMKLKPGDSKIVTLTRNQQLVKILITASVLRSDEKVYKLIAFQNVSEALDETESKAWQKLLNVMTHEIMNSVAPISSLADTLKNRLQSPEISSSVKSSDLEDLELGIDTIKRRSEGLLKFTESYRSLNKITKLDLTKILVRNLFETLNSLMRPTLEKKHIELEIILRDPTLSIEADINLIEQVLINLMVNAVEAVKDKEKPRLTLSAEIQSNNKTLVKVMDNGMGMPPELLDKIFIPFFFFQLLIRMRALSARSNIYSLLFSINNSSLKDSKSSVILFIYQIAI